MTRRLLLVFCVVLASVFQAQNKYDKKFYLIDIDSGFVFNPIEKHDVDSILQLYHATQQDTLRLYYLRIFAEYLSSEYLWTRYNALLYRQSMSSNDSIHRYYRACALNNTGYELQYVKNDLEAAKKKYRESYELFKELNNAAGLGVEINNLAYIYQHEGNLQKSVELYMEAGKLFEKLNAPLGLANIYVNLGDIYFKNDELNKAEEFFNKALVYAVKTEQETVLANVYNQLAAVYNRVDSTTKAIRFYKKALAIYQKTDNYSRLALVSLGLSNTYAKQKDQPASENFVLFAYRNSLKSPDLQVKARVYNKVALLYIGKSDFRRAEAFADSAYRFAKQLSYSELQAEAAQDLSTIYRQQGDFRKAYLFLNEAKLLQDSLKSDATRKSIIRSQYQLEYNKKSIELKAEQDKKDAIRAAEKRQQQLILIFVIIALSVIAVFAFVAYKNYMKAKKQNVIIEHQKALVDEKQKEIVDSITYAKHLQEAILTPREFINAAVPSNFILYKPKDLVAGDFYWAERVQDYFFIAAADSTGHGVPGALVSVVCSNALNRSVREFQLLEPGEILDKTRELVIETFTKSNSGVRDGMDISLLRIDLTRKELAWSGANNPLWLVANEQLQEIKGDKQPVGKYDHASPFKTHRIPYTTSTMLYLFTDGMADQFGGPEGKKFKYKQLSQLLLKIHQLEVPEQEKTIEKHFEDWKGSLEQVDDVCLIGIRL